MDTGLRQALLGVDPVAADPEELWDRLYVATAMTGRRGALVHALGALDIALWDLRGKAAGVPTWQLLGSQAESMARPYASLLPHLAGLEATEGGAAFHKAIRTTILAIAAFAGLCAVGLLAIGPWALHVAFDKEGYTHIGLAVIAVGMGLHLTAGTLNQAALARGRAHQAAAAWLAAAVLFVLWMIVPIVSSELTRAEVGYAGCAAILCGLLYALYTRGPAAEAAAPAAA